MVLAEQIKEIEQRREALERCLDIDQKRIDLRNEEEKTQEPNFWDNPDKAREQLRKVAGIKAWVEDYDAIRKDAEDLQLMPDFVKEGVVSEEEMDAHYAATLEKIEKLEMRNMLRRDEDKLGAILDINAGAGGTAYHSASPTMHAAAAAASARKRRWRGADIVSFIVLEIPPKRKSPAENLQETLHNFYEAASALRTRP